MWIEINTEYLNIAQASRISRGANYLLVRFGQEVFRVTEPEKVKAILDYVTRPPRKKSNE